ncbi:substrate-binding domain-containing protein [Crateriforma spongiae]|uniref:substrate-binding domain-containing protein n=1 Tax=Crateriforma spongiae TaxID=2724528 RepID=UPI001447FC49|nr:substrate-binding domain-containing protein [Crateriforma spongiae]
MRSNVLWNSSRLPILACVLAGFVFLAISGCGSSKQPTASEKERFPLQAGRYTVLGILTDNQDNNKAKENAEATLLRHPEIKCMVGLWSANTPMILAALRSSERLGDVAVVGFDEHPDTLNGIAEGNVYGTVVQNPYAFGYRSVQWLTMLAKGQAVDVPESSLIYIPHRRITEDNVQQFRNEVARMKKGEGPLLAPDLDLSGDGVRLAYITNSTDPFWTLAEDGCERAAGQFGCDVDVQMPSAGTIEEQKRFLESNVANQLDGIAISPIDPENQVQMINEACDATTVICQDSDAPKSKRQFYLGTSNYMAGREAGKLIKEIVPDGGEIMLFVGKLEVLNAQERSQGIIDELADKPIPAALQTP